MSGERYPEFLHKRAQLTPERTAFHVLKDDRRITYAALDEAAQKTAFALATRGVGAGDRVAVIARSRVEVFTLLFACGKLGAILAPLNWRAPAAELSGLVEDARPRLLLHGAADIETAHAVAKMTGTPAHDIDAEALDEDAAPEIPLRAFVDADETWYILYTSGTTGRPKGVIQTPRMALVNAINIGGAIDLREDDRTLCFLPLFHAAGFGLHTLPTLFTGGTVLMAESFDPAQILDLIGAGAVDTFFGVPAIYRALSEEPGFDQADFTKARHYGCGGAPLPDALARLFAQRGARICNGMGMTETGPTAFLARPDKAVEKIGSVGRPQRLVEARILRADGSEADVDETGELQFAGPGLTPGYWERPEETKALYTPDGWLKTGDLAKRDVEGDHYIVGRAKEMFISGGENVYPAEVENALCDHPDVAEAAVVAAPDPQWGEVGCAFVILNADARFDAGALDRHCREHLAAFKAPKRYVPMTDFPRTAAGKARKHLLKIPNEGARALG